MLFRSSNEWSKVLWCVRLVQILFHLESLGRLIYSHSPTSGIVVASGFPWVEISWEQGKKSWKLRSFQPSNIEKSPPLERHSLSSSNWYIYQMRTSRSSVISVKMAPTFRYSIETSRHTPKNSLHFSEQARFWFLDMGSTDRWHRDFSRKNAGSISRHPYHTKRNHLI